MWHRKITLVALAFGFVAPGQLYAQGACDAGQLSSLPDVRLVSASEEIAPVPHCKIAGVIGTETNFELLLPDCLSENLSFARCAMLLTPFKVVYPRACNHHVNRATEMN